MTTKTALAPRQLTELQGAFVANYVEHGDAHKAALAAGYAPATARTAGTEILRLPHVAQAVALAVHRRLVASAPMALAMIEELARNAVSMKVRLDAAKTLMDRAGHVPPRAADIVRLETPLNEMSVEELHALAARLEEEVANRATVVSNVTGLPVEQLVDLMN
jgi:phage terminase small subunit